MVVKITRIMFSGDTEMANKCIQGKKPSLWQRLKNRIIKMLEPKGCCK